MNTIARKGLMIVAGLLSFGLGTVVYAQTADPSITKLIGIDQKLGNQVPKDAMVTDETGRQIKFGDLLGKRPLVVLPVFYQCASACEVETDNLMKTLLAGTKGDILRPNRDFDVVFLSIDPRETADLAARKKNVLMAGYHQPGTEDGWHLLTGDYKNIRRITDALGFRYTFDPATGRINHPTGMMFISPNGTISSYLIGIQFPTQIMLDDVARAARNEVGPRSESFLFGCIMTDPVTGHRRMVIESIVRLAALLTLIILVVSILKMSFGTRSRPTGQGAR